MKAIVVSFFGLLCCLISWSQQGLLPTPHMNPKIGEKFTFSAQGEKDWQKHDSICTALWAKDESKLTKAENKFLETCSEVNSDYYEAIGAGCSWYCGGGSDSCTVSSYLPEQKGNVYNAESVNDLSFETAWVEGVSGDGVGEKISFYFHANSPRVTEILIANGYVKSEKAWKENGRVKSILFSVNGVPVAVFLLDDIRALQSFEFAPIGYSREEYTIDELRELPPLVFTFEILDVYPGSKYHDTAISEIFFDGVDVH